MGTGTRARLRRVGHSRPDRHQRNQDQDCQGRAEQRDERVPAPFRRENGDEDERGRRDREGREERRLAAPAVKTSAMDAPIKNIRPERQKMPSRQKMVAAGAGFSKSDHFVFA